MDSLPDPPTPSLDSVLSVRTVGTTRLPHRGIIVDLTLLLSTQPELRHGSCLEHLGEDALLLIQFDNTRGRGDPVKKFVSRSFPSLHYDIHSRAWSAILVECTSDGLKPWLLSEEDAEDARRIACGIAPSDVGRSGRGVAVGV